MTTLFLDPFAGIAGDMFLGLVVDLGVAPEALRGGIASLSLAGYTLAWEREARRGITGSRCRVEVGGQQPHRTWADIDALLAASALAPPVRELARRIFRRIGIAEGKIHGVPLERVHFHEIGAVDSIVDVVGAALAWQLLGQPRVVSAPLPLSRGFVECAHGTFPLPAPATLEILRGCPVTDGGSDRELVTPTGAAIVAELATFGPLPAMTVDRTGYGVGSRHLEDRPNLLRGILGEEDAAAANDRVEVLETHLDDANPEWLGALLDDLLQAGALDVAYAPLQMKKNRPGVRVTVIAPLGRGDHLARTLLRASSAIGVRRQVWERFKLARETTEIDTEIGRARVKLLRDGETLLRITPEFESCRRLAQSSGRPLPEVYRLVERAADSLFPASSPQCPAVRP